MDDDDVFFSDNEMKRRLLAQKFDSQSNHVHIPAGGATAAQLMAAKKQTLMAGYGGGRYPFDERRSLRTYTRGELVEIFYRLKSNQVVGWVMDRRYSYVAVRVNDSWYTTATEDNPKVGQILTHHQLADILLANQVEGLAMFEETEYI